MLVFGRMIEIMNTGVEITGFVIIHKIENNNL
jgi:hypothetical protein